MIALGTFIVKMQLEAQRSNGSPERASPSPRPALPRTAPSVCCLRWTRSVLTGDVVVPARAELKLITQAAGRKGIERAPSQPERESEREPVCKGSAASGS